MRILFFSLFLFFSNFFLKSQDYQLEWQDSIECQIYGFADILPLLVLDSENEAIYVGAQLNGLQVGVVLTKYDFEGNKLWEIDDPGGYLGDIKLDDAGNIYLRKEPFSLTKYNPSGEQEWKFNHYFNPPDIIAQAQDFLITETGEIFMSGRYSDYTQTPVISTAHLVKLNPEGDILWIKDYDTRIGWKMNILQDTLNILGSNGWNVSVLNCSLDGDSLSYNEFPIEVYGFISPYAVSDNSGNFYSGSWFELYAASKVNSKGKREWSYKYEPADSNEAPLRAHYVKPDSEGNVYIAGQIFNGDSYVDLLITKLDST